MFSPAEMMERHAAVLAELSELGMAFARDARRDAEAAETPEERARQALVFQRVSRSIRQSLALEARLVRELKRDVRDDADRAAKLERQKVDARRNRIRTGVEALIWRETEDMDEDEEAVFDEQIDDAVHVEVMSDTFFSDDLGDQVGRVLERLGFQVGTDGVVRRVPPPEPEVDREGAWRGSG
ncbi:hypothetical protein ACO2Q0_13565 [Phenylobacterium sp. VNQ135]|uniref:hypothetical protein n=1 Tax=Phenylobacterium sp. VNQ135 TaxID=3400922 RepID=UPI003C00902D